VIQTVFIVATEAGHDQVIASIEADGINARVRAIVSNEVDMIGPASRLMSQDRPNPRGPIHPSHVVD
jgi:hypothetical protein